MSATELEVTNSLNNNMTITGEIVLIETTPGRREPWVTKQTPTDYLLTFKITGIGAHEITNCASGFMALQPHLPSIVTEGNCKYPASKGV